MGSQEGMENIMPDLRLQDKEKPTRQREGTRGMPGRAVQAQKQYLQGLMMLSQAKISLKSGIMFTCSP